jgi:hypothetical protein
MEDRSLTPDEQLTDTTVALTRVFRTAMKASFDSLPAETLLTYESCWKALVFLIDTSLLTCKEKIEDAVADAYQIAKERANVAYE